VGSALLNLLLNYWLIPIFGIIGAAFATFVSAAAIFFAYMFYSQRYYYVPHNWNSIISGVAFTMLIVYGCLFFSLSPLVGVILKMLTICLIIIFLIFVQMITTNDLLLLKHKANGFYTRFKSR